MQREYACKVLIKEDICDETGKVFIKKGREVVLNTINVEKFKRLGIYEKVTSNLDVDVDMVEESRSYEQFRQHVDTIVERYKPCHTVDLGSAIDYVQTIMFDEKIFKKYPHLTTLVEHSEWHYTHSINVAILAVLIAREIGYSEEALHDIAIGALLHDIGVIFIDQAILVKADLSEEEKKIVEKHCSLGVMTMRGAAIPKVSEKIIEQHHECINGTGYPHQIEGEAFLQEAQIVSIADQLDKQTSSMRDDKGKTLGEAIRMMYSMPDQYNRCYTEVLGCIFEI